MILKGSRTLKWRLFPTTVCCTSRRAPDAAAQKEIDDQLTAAYGAKKSDVVMEFKQAFPRKKVQDVLYFANGSRPGVKQTLAWKGEKSKTPVWNYLFAWEYPVNGGITSFHCSEIAFAFHNVNEPHVKLATGGGATALARA